MTKPLEGVTILDLTNVLAGPFCCHQLAHLGARVIKIETPGRGDHARQLGADPELSEQLMGVSFLAQNAGKQSLTLNLKHAQGKKIFKQLVECADVVVENFRPGVMERLDLGADTLRGQKPELIYAAISGFGQDGPWVHRPAYDQIIQGASGLMSITGDPASAPLRTGFPVADTIGGLTAAMAISAALNAKPRGAVIDVSMLESLLATMGWVISNWLIAGTVPQAHGNQNPTAAPSGTFKTGDGLLNIAANKPEQWEILAHHVGRGDWLERADFASREDRKANRAILQDEIEHALSCKPARQWAKELNQLGVPAGAILSVPEVLEMPQIAERGMLASFKDVPGTGRDIQLVRTGLKIDGAPPSVASPPPELGADTATILTELGHNQTMIDQWRADGVI